MHHTSTWVRSIRPSFAVLMVIGLVACSERAGDELAATPETVLEDLCVQACAQRFADPACTSEGLDLCIGVCPSVVANLPAECVPSAQASAVCDGSVDWTCDANDEPTRVDPDACVAETAAFEACAFGPTCGDSVCSAGESDATCPDDCVEQACGDGECSAEESFEVCPADCAMPASICGDGECDADEDAVACPDDCAPDGDPGGDADGIADADDNCPTLFNPDQADSDDDGLGDLCDSNNERVAHCLSVCERLAGCGGIVQCGAETVDTFQMRCAEGCAGALLDTVLSTEGAPCEAIANQALEAFDVDCEPADVDADGVPDPLDNCPQTANVDQTDIDEDGLGDACDDESRCVGADLDGDWLCDRVDACPEQAAIFTGPFAGFAYEFEDVAQDVAVDGMAIRNRLHYQALNRPSPWVVASLDSRFVRHRGAPMDALDRAFLIVGWPSERPPAVRTTVRLERETAAMSFSIRVASNGPVNDTVRFLSSFEGAGGVRDDELVFDRLANGALRLIAGGATVTSDRFAQLDADWHRFGFTFDAGRVTFFVDGQQHGAPVDLGRPVIPAQRFDWHLVEDVTNATNAREYLHFGRYDEPVLLHDRALSVAQMAGLGMGWRARSAV